MLNFLRQLFDKGRPQIKSMLSAQQACAIAESAVAGTHCAGTMNLSKIENLDGKLIWRVSSVTVGSGTTVMIDDSTRAVLRSERWGVR